MNIRPIKTEADHAAAVAELETLMDAEPGSEAFDRLEVLSMLVDAYEAKAYPIDPPDPVDAILFRMEQLGWTRKDIEPAFGSRARVSEVLNRKRPLTLPMIRRLNAEFGIPAEALIRDYRTGG